MMTIELRKEIKNEEELLINLKILQMYYKGIYGDLNDVIKKINQFILEGYYEKMFLRTTNDLDVSNHNFLINKYFVLNDRKQRYLKQDMNY